MSPVPRTDGYGVSDGPQLQLIPDQPMSPETNLLGDICKKIIREQSSIEDQLL